MKRTYVVLTALFFSFPAFAAEAHRFVVGVRQSLDRRLVMRAALGTDGAALAERRFRDFDRMDAFAADLTDDEAAALRRSGDVRYVEPSMPVHAFGAPALLHRATPLLRDPNRQTTPYGISLVDAPAAWTGARGDSVDIAIVDTGIDYNHPDLKGEYAGGFNAVLGTTDPFDDNGHGTHVAGTIAAEDNGLGVVGVAPHARLWAVKVLGADGSGSTATIADGFNWVLKKKAEVGGNWIINMSLGICSDPTDPSCADSAPQALLDACRKAADAGVLIFAASGNDSLPDNPAPVAYPAAFPTVVAVGAVDQNDVIADFSNRGPELAVVAPGIDVLSTVPVGTASNAFVEQGKTLFDAAAVRGSKSGSVSGKYVFCGFGATAGEFPSAVKGNIALIERGNGVSFNQKTKNALSAGASAVIISNCSKSASPASCTSDSGFTSWTLIKTTPDGTDDPADLAYAWPVVLGVSKETGDALRAAADKVLTAANTTDDYDRMSGTSMACPHAVGVAALVWSAAPLADAEDIKVVMLQHAQHLGDPGTNAVYGHGLVDAYATAKSIAPQLFGSGATPTTPPTTGRRVLKRGH